MKSTGVIRRIDDLGRIVIPKEIRNHIGIRDGEYLEFFVDNEDILMKKYSKLENFIYLANSVSEIINDLFSYNIFITDRDKVISASDSYKKIVGFSIDDYLKSVIDHRKIYSSNNLESLSFCTFKVTAYFILVPIIVAGDSLGLLVLFNNNSFDDSIYNILKFILKLFERKIDIA